MGARGRATKGYNPLDRRLYQDLARVLRYGQTWRAAGFTCTSRTSGLTCTNRAAHGWWLGRHKGYRLF